MKVHFVLVVLFSPLLGCRSTGRNISKYLLLEVNYPFLGHFDLLAPTLVSFPMAATKATKKRHSHSFEWVSLASEIWTLLVFLLLRKRSRSIGCGIHDSGFRFEPRRGGQCGCDPARERDIESCVVAIVSSLVPFGVGVFGSDISIIIVACLYIEIVYVCVCV